MAISFQINSDFKDNSNVTTVIELENRVFNMAIKWDEYCDCAFLNIYDIDLNPIIEGRALVNNLLIRTDRRLLPKDLRFEHINGETFEPTLDNISEEFTFIYG